MFGSRLAILFPLLLLAFFPMMQDMYDTGRSIVYAIYALIVLAYTGYLLIKTKHLTFTVSATSIGFGALTLASLASLFVQSTNQIEAITHPLGLITFLSLFVISSFLPHTVKDHDTSMILSIMSVSAGIVGLLAIYQYFSITSSIFPNSAFLKNALWNPTGTPISALLLFITALPITISIIINAWKKREEARTAIHIVSLVLILVGMGLTAWQFLPMVSTVVMPWNIGWTVLLESFKQMKTALFGVGAENFLAAYALGRPLAINTTPLWNTGFSTSATTSLHVATTLGITGAVATILFCIAWLTHLPKPWLLRVAWIFLIVAIIALPPSIPLLILIVSLDLAVGSHNHKTLLCSGFLQTIILIIIIGVVSISSYGLYRFTKGELYYTQARLALESDTNLTKSYTLHIAAITENPSMTRYHMSLSQLALVIANSILESAPMNDQTGTVTLLDEDKQLVTQLFTLAISEGKRTTQLAPTSYVSWVNLATIYQSLEGVATDADTWMLASYQKALTLNPYSPTLRVDVGGAYLNKKDYDSAIAQFLTAIALKPNYANAYYNLANAYQRKGNTVKALEALIQTQSFLSKTSVDYQKISDEITTIQSQTPETMNPTQTPNQQISPTTTKRTPLILPELTLPEKTN